MTDEVFGRLAAPMPFKWRLKTVTNKAQKPYPEGTRGQFLAYIDARDVFNRLDEVVGPANWQSKVSRVNEDKSVLVTLGVKVAGEWVEREDCGYPNNPGSSHEEEPLKAAVSDGVKRAAVQFGIGRFLYDLDAKWVELKPNGDPKQPLPNGSGAAPAKASSTRPSQPHEASDGGQAGTVVSAKFVDGPPKTFNPAWWRDALASCQTPEDYRALVAQANQQEIDAPWITLLRNAPGVNVLGRFKELLIEANRYGDNVAFDDAYRARLAELEAA